MTEPKRGRSRSAGPRDAEAAIHELPHRACGCQDIDVARRPETLGASLITSRQGGTLATVTFLADPPGAAL